MSNIILPKTLSYEEKITLMREDSRFDIADDSLGVDTDTQTDCSYAFDGDGDCGGNLSQMQNIADADNDFYDNEKDQSTGLFNDKNKNLLGDNYFDKSLLSDIKSKLAPPTVPKLFVANKCIFNCAYCGCRASNDGKQLYCNNPKELAQIAVNEAHKNGRGVFITSAIHMNADYTEELIIETIKSMRQDLLYKGYIHAKIMPGTDPLLIKQAGLYADRLSVNIEVAHSDGYEQIAKQKNKQNILLPMKNISDFIAAEKSEKSHFKPKFATSQTTQLMAGSTNESDRVIMNLSKALYKTFSLKRVYYTGFQYKHPAKGYENMHPVSTPKWRVRRLYQADRLLQLYGFSPDDITPEQNPFLKQEHDPKLAWALRNLDIYPIEINTADYEELIRIPGIGITYAKKILKTREYCNITHKILENIGVPFKKSIYFLSCGGKYLGGKAIDNCDTLSLFLAEPKNILQTADVSSGLFGDFD